MLNANVSDNVHVDGIVNDNINANVEAMLMFMLCYATECNAMRC